MSFNQAKFATVGAHSSDTPSIYSYSTSDSLSAVIATDYFKPKRFQLGEGDWIFAIAGACNAILQVQSDKSTALVSSVFVQSPAYAEFHLTTTPEVVALDDDGVTYTKVPNMVLATGVRFTVTGGTLTCLEDGKYVINGTSDVEANKALMISYALFIDDVVVPSEITPHTFTNQSKIENISITAIATLIAGQEIEIRVKGDGTLSSEVTVDKLDVTFVRIADA